MHAGLVQNRESFLSNEVTNVGRVGYIGFTIAIIDNLVTIVLVLKFGKVIRCFSSLRFKEHPGAMIQSHMVGVFK